MADLFKKHEYSLNIPPFRSNSAQFTTESLLKPKRLQIYVFVWSVVLKGRVKDFFIFDGILPASVAPLASQIFQDCFWELNEVQSPYVVGLNKRNDFCEN